MSQHIFIWAPYQGHPGEKKLIDRPMHSGSLKEALDIACNNQSAWRKQYGEGQVIVASVASYLGLH